MNPLDWMLAILLTYSVVRAALNGFLREAFSLGGIVVGFLLACWYYRDLAPHLSGLITSPPFALFAAFIVLLGGTMIVAHVVAMILRRGAKTIGLGFYGPSWWCGFRFGAGISAGDGDSYRIYGVSGYCTMDEKFFACAVFSKCCPCCILRHARRPE